MGSSVARLDPIRYVVREASNRLHCAQPARSRRVMVGIHHVFFFPSFLTHAITRLRVATNTGDKLRSSNLARLRQLHLLVGRSSRGRGGSGPKGGPLENLSTIGRPGA
jgi:hypothetical protein